MFNGSQFKIKNYVVQKKKKTKVMDKTLFFYHGRIIRREDFIVPLTKDHTVLISSDEYIITMLVYDQSEKQLRVNLK